MGNARFPELFSIAKLKKEKKFKISLFYIDFNIPLNVSRDFLGLLEI
jgi:hypothetical protein